MADQNYRSSMSVILLALLGVLGTSVAAAETQAENKLTGVSVSVSLEQGVVDVNSTQGQMSHFRESTAQTLNEFDAFKKQASDGIRKEKEAFEKYKDQVKREFVGYVQSITMASGTELVIVDNVAVERKTTGAPDPAREFMQRWRSENP